MLQRIRDWRLDRRVDRVARRPHGRKARQTYGADEEHSYLVRVGRIAGYSHQKFLQPAEVSIEEACERLLIAALNLRH